MNKFEIEYYVINTRKEEIEARTDYEAIKKFREENLSVGIKGVKYIYTGKEELKEWYCNWWNGYGWKSAVVMAHDREEVEYNIKHTLDELGVYDFGCCPNTPEAIDALHRSKWD